MTLIIALLILLLLFGGGFGYRYGGPFIGGGIDLVLLVLLVLAVAG